MNPADHPDHAIDREVLISRVVDGEASAADWGAFRALAERDPGLWRELAEAQRTHADLAAAVESALAIADGVEAPMHEYMSRRLSDRLRVAGAWGGWLAAAALALAWAAGMPADGSRAGGRRAAPDSAVQQAALPGLDSMAAAWQAYLDRGHEAGRVVGEAPTVLVQAEPAEQGQGYEVLYLRQVLERAVVPDLYQLTIDEWGQPVPVRAAAPVRTVHGAM